MVYSFISKLPQFWVAVGIHPKKIRYNNPGILAELDQLLTLLKVVGLSELGVDYSTDPKFWEPQWEFVEYVLRKKFQQGLVLILHVQTSPVGPPEEEVYSCLRLLLLSHCHPYQFIHFHNFTGPVKQLHEWLHSFPNICFGVSGLVQYFSHEQREMIRQIPSTRLLLETDSPYFPLNPGVRIQTPLGVGEVGRLVAAERNESFRDLMRSTAFNARRLYSGCGPAWSGQ